jgi:hypothetical protein
MNTDTQTPTTPINYHMLIYLLMRSLNSCACWKLSVGN